MAWLNVGYSYSTKENWLKIEERIKTGPQRGRNYQSGTLSKRNLPGRKSMSGWIRGQPYTFMYSVMQPGRHHWFLGERNLPGWPQPHIHSADFPDESYIWGLEQKLFKLLIPTNYFTCALYSHIRVNFPNFARLRCCRDVDYPSRCQHRAFLKPSNKCLARHKYNSEICTEDE